MVGRPVSLLGLSECGNELTVGWLFGYLDVRWICGRRRED